MGWLYRICDGDITTEDEQIIATIEPAYDILAMITFLLIPSGLEIIALIRIFRVSQQNGVDKREDYRLYLMLITMFSLFFVCTTPLFVLRLLVDLQPQLLQKSLGLSLLEVFYTLKHAVPLANPLVYVFMKPDVRRACRNTFR